MRLNFEYRLYLTARGVVWTHLQGLKIKTYLLVQFPNQGHSKAVSDGKTKPVVDEPDYAYANKLDM